jgi:diaminopimelate epimerase
MKHLRVPLDDDISVNMGKVTDEMEEIEASSNGHTWAGFNISVGNPHAVVFVDSLEEVGSLENAPIVSPASSYPEGVNVEFVELLPNFEAKMRVHERGSGETRSCGTGTCAVALAATLHSKGTLPSRWTIYPPGGRLVVDIDGHSNATLIGPAVILKDHDISKYLSA